MEVNPSKEGWIPIEDGIILCCEGKVSDSNGPKVLRTVSEEGIIEVTMGSIIISSGMVPYTILKGIIIKTDKIR